MAETTNKPASSGGRQQNNVTLRVNKKYCLRGIIFLLMLEVAVVLHVGAWFTVIEEKNQHQSMSMVGSSTFVEKGRKAKPENRTFTDGSTKVGNRSPWRKSQLTGNRTFTRDVRSSTFVEKNRTAKPENRTFTRRQHQKHDCYEKSNEFDFPEHGCSVMNSRVHCQFSSLRLNTSKIVSQARGGEPCTVLGQAENVEFLSYRPGAFSVARPFENVLRNNKFYHYMSDVLGSLQVNALSDEKELGPCSTTWKGTTLFLTRYEYVNLYHTLTDWWNTFYALPTKNGTDVLDLPINIVLLDAHPQGNLDSVWQTLLGGNVAYARHLQDELVCFETARFVPAGYTSPSSRSNELPPKVALPM
jgi:hypothetical protein